MITAGIPLASEVIVKGGTALNPREGELYTQDNITSRLYVIDGPFILAFLAILITNFLLNVGLILKRLDDGVARLKT